MGPLWAFCSAQFGPAVCGRQSASNSLQCKVHCIMCTVNTAAVSVQPVRSAGHRTVCSRSASAALSRAHSQACAAPVLSPTRAAQTLCGPCNRSSAHCKRHSMDTQPQLRSPKRRSCQLAASSQQQLATTTGQRDTLAILRPSASRKFGPHLKIKRCKSAFQTESNSDSDSNLGPLQAIGLERPSLVGATGPPQRPQTVLRQLGLEFCAPDAERAPARPILERLLGRILELEVRLGVANFNSIRQRDETLE